MNAKELRIGNLLKIEGFEKPSKVVVIDITQTSTMTRCKPIQLTEKWLLNFGFEHREFSFDKGSFFLMKRTGKAEYLYQAHTRRFQVKYVHQLQNLFFALTGEELVLSDSVS